MELSATEYLKKGIKPLASESSVLVSSSKYLNSPALRHVVAQEMLRKQGQDLPPEYFIPEIISAFDELIDRDTILKLFRQQRQTSPRFSAWIERGFLSRFDASVLAEHKPGTLGALIHEFITKSGFDMDFMFKGVPQDDYAYWLKRFIQTHDVQHMVTGFDLTPVGEYGLIMLNTTEAFGNLSAELAAELTRQPTLSIACGLMQANLHEPHKVPLVLAALDRGRAMAKKLTTPLFYVEWEDYLSCSIDEVRLALGIADGVAGSQ